MMRCGLPQARSSLTPYCLRIRSTWTNSRYPGQVNFLASDVLSIYGFAVYEALRVSKSSTFEVVQEIIVSDERRASLHLDAVVDVVVYDLHPCCTSETIARNP